MTIAGYLRIFVNKSRPHIAAHLSPDIITWAGVRIQGGGDNMRCGQGYRLGRYQNERDSSYVRVCQLIDFLCQLTNLRILCSMRWLLVEKIGE
jgi:hypothetical protein